jgi:peptide/nickel transport system substrate-binding protein
MATYIEPPGLDPLVASGSGDLGGTEMMAIYDTVMRYNPANGNYEPRTAQSLTANGDDSSWTLKLKPNIKFSDGTDYDAAAVKYSLDRHRSGLPGAPPCDQLRACPRNSTISSSFMSYVKSTDVVDKLTLQIALTGPLPELPAILAAEPGMVPSPTALRAACPATTTATPATCPFNLHPVGAGPFTIDAFTPHESITMKANPSYWGGPVYLDGLKFINLGDAGSAKTYQGLKSGSEQVALLRDPAIVAQAKAEGYAGSSMLTYGGNIVLINDGVAVTCASGKPAPTCTGRPDGPYTPASPTTDVTVRQAIGAAVDPDQINARVYGGKGLVGSELFPKTFRYYPAVPGPKYDLTQAKQLVEKAKSAGWDGKIQYITDTAPSDVQTGLTLEAMLQAAGMTVQVSNIDPTTLALDKRTGNYETASHGLGITDDGLGVLRSVIGNLQSTAAGNRMGYKSAEMDSALQQLLVATTNDAKKAAYAQISRIYAQDVPFLNLASVEEFIAWNSSVHGVTAGSESEVYLDKTWLAR